MCRSRAVTPSVIIPDRAEFIDALQQLRQGRMLMRSPEDAVRCMLDGAMLYTAYTPMWLYGLLEECKHPTELTRVHCYRLSARGREFAEKACTWWARLPLLTRLVVRLTG
jgi:hypothetical protein